MSFPFYFVLIGLTFVITLMLIVIILLQQSKSGGGLGFLSGGATEAFLGANAGNVLTKSTAWMLVTFLVLVLVLAWGASRLRNNQSSSIADEPIVPAKVQPGKTPPTTPVPVTPTTPEIPATTPAAPATTPAVPATTPAVPATTPAVPATTPAVPAPKAP